MSQRDGVKIVNVCRGGLLDESAVIHYLENGKIGGLGLDVQWFEPFDPHHAIAQHPKLKQCSALLHLTRFQGHLDAPHRRRHRAVVQIDGEHCGEGGVANSGWKAADSDCQ